MRRSKMALAAAIAATMVMGSAAGVVAAPSKSTAPSATATTTAPSATAGTTAPSATAGTTAPSATSKLSSKTVGVTVVEKIEETDAFKEFAEKFPTVAEAVSKVNKGELDMAGFLAAIEGDAELAEALKDTKFVTVFSALTLSETVEGKLTVTLQVPALTPSLENVQMLHVNNEGVAEVIKPTDVNTESKTVTFEVDSTKLGYLAVIAKA